MSIIDHSSSPWEQCYAYFDLEDREFDEQIASLRLAFYLAHFGMFRASGRTRELRLKDFAKIVRACRRYKVLRDKGPKSLARRQDVVEEFLQTLSDTLKTLKVSPTDTLLSKIALGTTACMPAYDRFARGALTSNNVIATLSRGGLKALYALRNHDLERFGAKRSDDIPFMRALDIGLLKTGKALEKVKNEARKRSQS